MEEKLRESPFYLRFGITALTIAVLAAALYLGRGIFVPFLFAVLLATLLLPVVKFLMRWGTGKILAISVALITSMAFIGVIVYFLSTQIGAFLEDIPALEKRFKELLWEGQKWVNEHFNIGFRAQKEYLDETTERMNAPEVVNRTVLSITGVIS